MSTTTKTPAKKATNRELESCRQLLTQVNTRLFNLLGGPESLSLRADINKVSIDIQQLQKENKKNGDDSILML